jgi:hypothetical protein
VGRASRPPFVLNTSTPNFDMTLFRYTTAFLALLLFLSTLARAENIDLSTVPARDTVQLTIYNSEDITLVRETRTVTFKEGVNPLQFSWANTLIDPTSVELKFLTQADQLDVLDTTFPHDKPQMLVWNVQSEMDGAATIQITYFTSGITWTADYIAIADAAEKVLQLEGFVRVFNNSGEEYENAQVRLVVGTINLVEKIAQLAQVPIADVAKMQAEKLEEMKKDVTYRFMERASGMAGAGGGEADAKQKEITKEGLSEYFIYSIEGTETIPTGWSKRLRSLEAAAAPFKIQYRYRPNEYGEQLVRMYLLTNDEKSQLGTSPLPDGIVRFFRDNGRDGLSYLTQQAIKYIPIGDKIELNLGPDPEVIFELVKLRFFRDELYVQIHGTSEFRKVGTDEVIKQENASVSGWDEHEIFTQRIRNYSSAPIEIEVRRALPGHVIFRSQLEPVLHDFQTVQFLTKVAPSQRADLLFEVLRKQGNSVKQNNVTLVTGEVKP